MREPKLRVARTAPSPRADADSAAEPGADAALVEAARAGDSRAFELLVRAHQQGLYRVVFRYVRNQADALDVAQRALVRAYGALDSFRGDASFKTWLYRIGVNLAKNHLRDRRREVVAEIREDALTRRATGPMRIIREGDAERLRAAIATLPPKQRTVLELRVYEELSFRDIAAIAECSENSAKVNFHHAVKNLRAALRSEEDEP